MDTLEEYRANRAWMWDVIAQMEKLEGRVVGAMKAGMELSTLHHYLLEAIKEARVKNLAMRDEQVRAGRITKDDWR